MTSFISILETAAFVAWMSSGLFFVIFGLNMYGGLRRARARTSDAPVPAVSEWPHVTLQIAICNEGALVEPSLESTLAIDYPKDRLQIQFCDDSSDGFTSSICARVAAKGTAVGLNVHHLQRKERVNFKAGNLNEALKTATGEFIGVGDADCWFPRDFFKALLPVLLADEKACAVQGRFTNRNANANPITAMMQAAYDYHLEIEQPTRTRWNLWTVFNGSGGIWRRKAIEALGGWPYGTGVEDVYMSFRAQTEGWSVRYSAATSSQLMLPEKLESIFSQQSRWALGNGYILNRLAKKMWQAPASASAKREGFFHIGGYFLHVAMASLMFCAAPALLWVAQNPSFWWAGWVPAAGYAVLMAASTLTMNEARRRAGSAQEGPVATTMLGLLQTSAAPIITASYLIGLTGMELRGWKSSHVGKRLGQLLTGYAWTGLFAAMGLWGAWVALQAAQWGALAIVLMLVAGPVLLFFAPIWERQRATAKPQEA